MPTETNSRPVTTTAEQDRSTHARRTIDRLWERTQSIIAVAVTVATLLISGMIVLRDSPLTSTAFVLFSNAFFLVIGFYFGRTNHARSTDQT